MGIIKWVPLINSNVLYSKTHGAPCHLIARIRTEQSKVGGLEITFVYVEPETIYVESNGVTIGFRNTSISPANYLPNSLEISKAVSKARFPASPDTSGLIPFWIQLTKCLISSSNASPVSNTDSSVTISGIPGNISF